VLEEGEEEDTTLPLERNPLLKGCRARLPPLNLFDEKIVSMK